MIRTILVPLGRSVHNDDILPHVAGIALAHGARVILLHVVEPPRLLTGTSGATVPLGYEDQEGKKMEGVRLLERAQDRLRKTGVDAGLWIAQGLVADAIAMVATSVDADLVAMVSTHRPWISRVLRTSVCKATYDRLDRGCLLLIRSGTAPCQ